MRSAVTVLASLFWLACFSLPTRTLRADMILPGGDTVAAPASEPVAEDAVTLADASDGSQERVGELVSAEEAWELPIGIVGMVLGAGALFYWFHSL